MKLGAIDLIVQDVPAATAFFRDVVGLTVGHAFDEFAELDDGNIVLMFSPTAMVPVQPVNGVILHFEVENVQAAVDHAKSQGASILKEPFITDWGWKSCLVDGPEGIVVDFYRPIAN